jgi:iron complex outermembrane receptor protein
MSGAVLSGEVSLKRIAGAAALAGLMAALPQGQARAQGADTLPQIDVTDSRLGIGITGASSSVITREDIARSPQLTLADILAREAGVQTSSLFGGVNGAGTTVDLRGFGITGPSNTLILIDGRRLNDWDLPGFDLSTIARESIDRIEITRGNSGGVVYGDGAVGGVINIVTRKGVSGPPTARIEGAFGSFNTREANVAASASSGGFSTFVNGNAFRSDGYRDNNALHQKSGVSDFRYNSERGSVYFNIAADDQNLRLPGPRNYDGFSNQYLTDPRGTNTPYDYSKKQGLRLTGGFTHTFAPGIDLIVDGGARKKDQQGAYFSPYSEAYVDTTLWTYSVTPRLSINQTWLGLPTRILTGLDYYKTDYSSDRSLFQGLAPIHRYSGNLDTLAGYWQQTLSVLPTTDLSWGGRIQRNSLSASDIYDPTAPQGSANPQGLPLDRSETNHAYHLGLEHRFTANVAVFARMAQSFRVPNIDERIGAVPVMQVTDFDLQTQKSHDVEAGVRLKFGDLAIQSSLYDMRLNNELHFNPVTGKNENLEPTRRKGWETIASYRVNENVRLRGNLTWIDATFREGQFAGNTVPVVSKWAGSAGLSWNIVDRRLVLDVDARHFSRRYLDGNENNAAAIFMIPSRTLLDARLGGEIDSFFWSVSVQNLLNEKTYDYANDTSFPGWPFVSFYPQPGRTFMARAGMKW